MKKITTSLLLVLYLLMTHSFFAQVKPVYPNFGAQLKLCGLRSSPRELLPSLYFKGTHLFNHNRHFIFPNLTVGNSIYPTLAFAGDKSQGGIILGVEVPVALEMYYGNIESDYFFLGIGLAACAYALREYESFYGFGPYLAFGGDIPIWRGDFGWKFDFTLYNSEASSLHFNLGIFYQIGYGY